MAFWTKFLVAKCWMARRINNVNLHELDILNRRHKPTRIAEPIKNNIPSTLFGFFPVVFDKAFRWRFLVSYFLFSLGLCERERVFFSFSLTVVSITLYNFEQYFTLIYYYDSKSRPFSKSQLPKLPAFLWSPALKNTPI